MKKNKKVFHEVPHIIDSERKKRHFVVTIFFSSALLFFLATVLVPTYILWKKHRCFKNNNEKLIYKNYKCII